MTLVFCYQTIVIFIFPKTCMKFSNCSEVIELCNSSDNMEFSNCFDVTDLLLGL